MAHEQPHSLTPSLPPYLNGVHIMCYDNHLSLLLLNEIGHVIDPIFDSDGFLPSRHHLSLNLLLSCRFQSYLLLGFGFWPVLVQELEQLCG